MNEKENSGAKISAEKKVKAGSEFNTTEEKAQYEVFRNGGLPRDTIAKWISNDLKSVISLVSGCLNDKDVFEAIVDAYYKKYRSLHEGEPEPKKES